MSRFCLILLASLSTLMVGCSDPTIDASTDESLKQSAERVRDSLEGENQKEFEEALQTILMSQATQALVASAFGAAAGDPMAQGRRTVDGKTAEQIIADARAMKARQAEREREQALQEAKEIDEELEGLREKLDKIKSDESDPLPVLKSRFYWSESDFLSEPVIEITVRNNTKTAISRAYFDAVVSSPGRSVPWVADSFNHSISGGLEPGEETTWSLAPNRYSEWGRVPQDRNDLIMTAVAVEADGPDGETLFERLDPTELEEKITELEGRREALLSLE